MRCVHSHMPTDSHRRPAQDAELARLREQSADREVTCPAGAYTVEVELECPASAVPDVKESVTRLGDRAVTVVAPCVLLRFGAVPGRLARRNDVSALSTTIAPLPDPVTGAGPAVTGPRPPPLRRSHHDRSDTPHFTAAHHRRATSR
ncbi:hypothetical protein GKJPGBOP_00482 [Streptomyces paromomycinus]|uniref:Uncharacterized protein n=1 Tax=Streptomyces paromomycinus TaxID=92743 RepID=A0A401VUU2_STREY|nr:hypothetical protein GKJPGBOP_00482 [Streptomyces paromomycinus]